MEIGIARQCVVAWQSVETIRCYMRLPDLSRIDIFAPFFFLLILERAVGILPGYNAKNVFSGGTHIDTGIFLDVMQLIF